MVLICPIAWLHFVQCMVLQAWSYPTPYPFWTTRWLLWRPSGFWDLQSPRTWSGRPTLTPLGKRPSRGYTSCARSGSNIIQSFLCYYITMWFGLVTKQDIGTSMPSFQDLYESRVRKQARSTSADPSQPGHNLFQLLPSGRRYRALYAKTSTYRNGFFRQAIRNNPCSITTIYVYCNITMLFPPVHNISIF